MMKRSLRFISGIEEDRQGVDNANQELGGGDKSVCDCISRQGAAAMSDKFHVHKTADALTAIASI